MKRVFLGDEFTYGREGKDVAALMRAYTQIAADPGWWKRRSAQAVLGRVFTNVSTRGLEVTYGPLTAGLEIEVERRIATLHALFRRFGIVPPVRDR